MTRFWNEMVSEQIADHVRMVMSARQAPNQEMKSIEALLETETLVGPYAAHCARYLLLFKELVRKAVVEVRFGVKK